MEGRYPQAIRLIRTNCTDPAQETGFNEWYDRVHAPDALASGMISRVLRYRNADPHDAGPGYLAIHEVAWEDLEQVARAVARTRRRLTDGGGFHPALQIIRVESWKRIGPEFATPRTGQVRPVGIFVVESRCADPRRDEELNTWYNETHIPDLLDTGLFTSAYRFAAVPSGTIIGAAVPSETDVSTRDPAAAGDGVYLALYETVADPLAAMDEYLRAARPRLKAAGRLVEFITVTWRGAYRRLSHPDAR